MQLSFFFAISKHINSDCVTSPYPVVTTANSTTAYFSTATATATITPTSMLPTDLSKFGSPESSWTFLSGINLSRHFRS